MSSPVFYHINAKIKGGLVNQAQIDDSSIDMNYRRITTLGTPTSPTDAATKDYVDLNTLTTGSVMLTGTSYSILSATSTGTMILTIKGTTTGAPCGVYIFNKNMPNGPFAMTVLSALPGSSSGEQLEFTWDDSSALMMRKTDVDYDGIYTYRLV